MSKETKQAPEQEPVDPTAAVKQFELPKSVSHISGDRADEFIALLTELGIGKIINTVIREKTSDSQVMKPVTAIEQVQASLKSRQVEDPHEKIRVVQMNIDYESLMQLIVEKRAMSKLCAIIMDQPREEVNVAEASKYIPFFIAHSSTLLKSLTSLVISSV